jgi:cobyrinic acid a,c-diamide synthase
VIGEQIDLPAVRALAETAPPTANPSAPAPIQNSAASTCVRLGIFRDRAFGFYYQDDLDDLERLGAKLVFINAESDSTLPDVDALFIGGGFPETMMKRLSANAALRRQIRAAIEGGLPAYAECGGLMYLARSITWGDERYEMVGSIAGDVVMHERPQGRGYVRLEPSENFPWPAAPGSSGQSQVRGHEFHHSSLENLPNDTQYAYRVIRGHGIDGHHDGVIHKNLLAAYGHQRSTGDNPWTARFLAFVREHAAQRGDRPAPTRAQVGG